MSIEMAFRLAGMVAFGFLGWQVGDALPWHASFPQLSYGLAALGGAVGLLIAPAISLRPLQALQREVRRVPIQAIISATIGLLIGLALAALVSIPLHFLTVLELDKFLPVLAALLLGYLGITIGWARQRDLFALAGNHLGRMAVSSGAGPDHKSEYVLLDTSVIIDGRIADVSQTGFIEGTLLVPRFVLNELQHIADSADTLRRNRGRRGLDILNKLQKHPNVPFEITDMDVEGAREVDAKLVRLAKRLNCPVVTNDYNLNRVAELQGVKVLNINELANAVKAVVLPGETMKVRIIQEGKELGQGVGYLDDGTMVVIENGRRFMNHTMEVTVTRVLQTVAGRMIFATPSANGTR